MADCAIGGGPGTFGPMPRVKEFPDELFVRMPADTKRRLEELAGASPVPAVWFRQFILDAIATEEAKRARAAKREASGGPGVRLKEKGEQNG